MYPVDRRLLGKAKKKKNTHHVARGLNIYVQSSQRREAVENPLRQRGQLVVVQVPAYCVLG